MPEDWEKYWKKKTLLTRAVDFMREHYFLNIPIIYLGNYEGKTILEAGCGTSESLVRIAKKAKHVTAFDISPKALQLSKQNFEKHRIQKSKYSLALGNIQKMKFKDNTFDIVFNTGVVEHFDDDKINNKPVEEMVRVAKKGGKVVILVPMIYTPYYIYYLISRIPGLHGIFPWEPHRFYTLRMMRKQLKPMGLKFKIKLDLLSIYLVAEIRK